jgi:hypothetical protein
VKPFWQHARLRRASPIKTVIVPYDTIRPGCTFGEWPQIIDLIMIERLDIASE